jgi:hypothetical protein
MIEPGPPSPIAAFPAGLGAVIQHTVAGGELSALVVIHDDEGAWLVGDGINDPNLPDACGIYHLNHLVALDPSIGQAATLARGQCAVRDHGDQPWAIEPWE